MIHIIKHHIAKGSYTPWYDIIEFIEPHTYHEFDNKSDIERKLIGEPPYEDELIEHLKYLSPTSKDIVVFDYKYLNGYHHVDLELKLNQLSMRFGNCKFLLFDDDNAFPSTDSERFTIFSNIFNVECDDTKIVNIPINCNYYRYRASKQDYFPHLEFILRPFEGIIRQKKCNLFVGVDKKERLQVLKYFYNINLKEDSYIAYSGFTTTYDDNEISDSLLKFKKETLPIILDTPFEMSQMGSVNVEIPPLPFTMNSYFSCILETQILIGNQIHLSEKSWNPFISRNIPLILGSSFINQYLKEIGFWLADDLFDISPKFSAVDILNQYKSNLDIINKMSYSEIHDYYNSNIKNIDRNFENIKNAKFTYNSNWYKSIIKRNLPNTML